MSKKRNRHTEQFKREAVRLSERIDTALAMKASTWRSRSGSRDVA